MRWIATPLAPAQQGMRIHIYVDSFININIDRYRVNP